MKKLVFIYKAALLEAAIRVDGDGFLFAVDESQISEHPPLKDEMVVDTSVRSQQIFLPAKYAGMKVKITFEEIKNGK